MLESPVFHYFPYWPYMYFNEEEFIFGSVQSVLCARQAIEDSVIFKIKNKLKNLSDIFNHFLCINKN